MTVQHSLFGGKLHIYQRPNSRFWQCSTFLEGRNHRTSTKTDSLAQAKDFAEDWYLELKLQSRVGELRRPNGKKVGKTFAEAAARFLHEYEVITNGERNPRYVQGHKDRVRVHLNPFFGDKVLSEITPGLVQEYRIHRLKPVDATEKRYREDGRRLRGRGTPARSTLHHEIVCLRQILKTANRLGWLEYLPDLAAPFRGSGKISHRAWFSPTEYKQLYEATRERAKHPKKERWRAASETLHDYVLLMVNTGLRPDEAGRLEFRDVEVVVDDATGERILEIEVRGKRGVGFCKSMPGAVHPFLRLRKRVQGQPTDKLFASYQRELFNAILEEQGLKQDRDGQSRTAYSLRHTYICMRLMEGADIYQIAKNCRTSVEMIEKYYASHIKNTLDAAAINVRKAKRPKQSGKQIDEAVAA